MIPIFEYLGVFGFCTPDESPDATLDQVIRLCRILCIPLKEGEYAVGPMTTFLGLTGTNPSPVADMVLAVRLDNWKERRLARPIRSVLSARSISHTALEAIIGKINFGQNNHA